MRLPRRLTTPRPGERASRSRESNSTQTEQLRALLESTTALTEETRRLAEQLERLPREIFLKVRATADLATEASADGSESPVGA
jgi:hypothetical protein